MTVETFFSNFDYLADAPNGVQKLRELILQLAVQGKLVPQDPNDEPASVLLERIEIEKERLFKEGRLKKQKTLPEIGQAEEPFALPDGWQFVRLGDIANRIGSGSTPRGGKDAYVRCGIPFLRSQNIWNHGLELQNVAYITSDTHQKMSNTVVLPNDILLNITGASLGRCTVYPDGLGEANVSQHVTIIRPTDERTKFYLHLCILSPYTQALVWGRQVGMAREGLSKKVLELFEIPLPPLEEQKRIVAKVDQLMALCDELEARQEIQQQGRVRLNNAALDALLNASDSDEFAEHWQHICNNFDLLYDHPETIAKLRAAILQLAVQGKLVPQVNPGLWHEGVLGDVVESSEAGWSPRCENRPCTGEEWGVLKVSAVSWGKFAPNENKALPSRLEPRPRYVVSKGDFLISRANTAELVARSVVVDQGFPQLMMSDKIIRVHFCEDADPNYFNLVNSSPFAREYYAQVAGGTSSSMKNVSRKQILELPVVIPPLDEQKRIVAKVGQLMALCDELEAKLNKAQQNSEKLMEATVRQLLGNRHSSKPHISHPTRKTVESKPASKARKQPNFKVEPAKTLIAEPQAAYGGNITQIILDNMNPGREYSRADITTTTGISNADWTWAIRQLKEEGKVRQIGERRGARYRLN